jgi:hypothetical protein
MAVGPKFSRQRIRARLSASHDAESCGSKLGDYHFRLHALIATAGRATFNAEPAEIAEISQFTSYHEVAKVTKTHEEALATTFNAEHAEVAEIPCLFPATTPEEHEAQRRTTTERTRRTQRRDSGRTRRCAGARRMPSAFVFS